MEYYIELMCPICGRMMGRINPKKMTRKKEGYKIFYMIKGDPYTMPYLDYLEQKWDENKDFWALIRDQKDRFKIIGHYRSPEDNPALFQKFKEQIKRGLSWWLSKGWLTREDLEELLEEAG